MKKISLIFTTLIGVFLSSCNSNTNDILNNEEFESAINQEEITLNSENDFFSMFPEVLESEIIIPDKDEVGTIKFQPITVYGYTKISSTGLRKVAFSKANDYFLGMPSGVYLVEFYTVTKEINLPENSYIMSMPYGCGGWRPNKTSSDSGYSLEYGNDGKVYLTTRVACFKYKEAGQFLNIWKPTNLYSLHWNYGLGTY